MKKIQNIITCCGITIVIISSAMMTSCDCPYEEVGKESDYEYYRRTGYDRLTADRLPGLWQCYYPMYVGNVEFKRRSGCFPTVRLTSSWRKLVVQIIMLKHSNGATMENTSHLLRGIPLTNFRLLAICHQNSILETPMAIIRGLIVKPKIVLNNRQAYEEKYYPVDGSHDVLRR